VLLNREEQAALSGLLTLEQQQQRQAKSNSHKNVRRLVWKLGKNTGIFKENTDAWEKDKKLQHQL
jgi:hypothetical protein